MIFSLLCKDEWFLMMGFHHCPPMAGNVVFEGTKCHCEASLREAVAISPFALFVNASPPKGGRGNLKSSVIAGMGIGLGV
jgi:hypothetical protein